MKTAVIYACYSNECSFIYLKYIKYMFLNKNLTKHPFCSII